MLEMQKAIAILEKNRFRPDGHDYRDRNDTRLQFVQRSDHYEIRVTLIGDVMWELRMSPILKLKDLSKEQMEKLQRQLMAEVTAPYNLRPKMQINTEAEAPFHVAAHTCRGDKAEDLDFFLGWLV